MPACLCDYATGECQAPMGCKAAAEMLAGRAEIERLTRDAAFWKAERDAAVNHAVTYGPEIERLTAAIEDAVETLESMDLHTDNPLYDRLRAIID